MPSFAESRVDRQPGRAKVHNAGIEATEVVGFMSRILVAIAGTIDQEAVREALATCSERTTITCF